MLESSARREIIVLWIIIPFCIFGWNPWKWNRKQQTDSPSSSNASYTEAEVFDLRQGIARLKRYLRVYRWVFIIFLVEAPILCTFNEVLIFVHAVFCVVGLSWDLERRLCAQDVAMVKVTENHDWLLSSYPSLFRHETAKLRTASGQYNVTVRKYCLTLAIANSAAMAIWYQMLWEKTAEKNIGTRYRRIRCKSSLERIIETEKYAANMLPILALTLSPFVLAFFTISIPKPNIGHVYSPPQRLLEQREYTRGADAPGRFFPKPKSNLTELHSPPKLKQYRFRPFSSANHADSLRSQWDVLSHILRLELVCVMLGIVGNLWFKAAERVNELNRTINVRTLKSKQVALASGRSATGADQMNPGENSWPKDNFPKKSPMARLKNFIVWRSPSQVTEQILNGLEGLYVFLVSTSIALLAGIFYSTVEQ
ncbi:hypothetical protein BDD12DRAFT_914137, partial [Trichophaea hybrida]